MHEKLVGTKAASEMLGVSVSTVYRMIDKGLLHPTKTPGGQRRFDVEQLEHYKVSSKYIVAPQNPYQKAQENKMSNQYGLQTEGDQIDFLDVLSIGSQEQRKNIENKNAEKPVDPRNTLNDLNGGEWLTGTKSFFYQRGLGAKHPHAKIERQHPAPYSFQDIAHLITFFTKSGMKVLDPFGGVGSTAKACELEGRICTSIELQKQWNDLAIERLETEVGAGTSLNHEFILGDSRQVLKELETSCFDFMVTSPPYWSILNKKADHKVWKERLTNNLATKYSENDNQDLANVEYYDEFVNILVEEIFLECARVLKPKKYMAIVVSDFRHKSDYISFHSDLIQAMKNKEIVDGSRLKLQGVKVLLQNHKSLIPYGYPFAYVENIHHQYVLIFRKDKG